LSVKQSDRHTRVFPLTQEDVVSKGKNITLWILTAVLSLVFLATGGFKLAGAKEAVNNFQHWGYPDWFRLVTGGIEVTCALLLLVPRTTVLAGGLLICTMLGAMRTHIHSNELPMLPVPVVLAILLAVVVAGRWKGVRAAFLLPILLVAMGAMPAMAGKKSSGAEASGAKAAVVETPVAVEARDEPRQIAEQYLKAVAGTGDDAGRDLLLGGATMTAKIFILPNWKIVGRDPWKKETGDLAGVAANVQAIDRAGRAALATIMGGGPAGGGKDRDGLGTRELSAEDASHLLAPTRALATSFLTSHPVFAYVARVDRAVYWHPKNPIRALITQAGGKGAYQLDLNLFKVETLEGLGTPVPRVWPLRVLRLKTATLDTGWKILPASDWNGE
jgi:putative oxidoreductase